MIFRFGDINNNDMIDTASVLFVVGQHSIFNNIVIDKVKKACRGDIDTEDFTSDLYDEFFINDRSSSYGYLDFNEYLDVVKMTSMSGKWLCIVDYKMLTKKQRERLTRYMKTPNNNGKLLVYSQEYVDYKELLRNKVLSAHPNSHLIQLQFPNRSVLKLLVQGMFLDRGVRVPEKAIELFIMRMGNNYEQYDATIDSICQERENTNLSYKEFSEAMRGIENYVLDDFIEQLLKPIKSTKISTNRKVYRMLDSIIQDIGVRATVNKVKYKLDELIEIRILINKGIIPINIKYSVKESKERVGEKSKAYKMNDYHFRKVAELASRTSLRDLVFMKMILSNIKSSWDEKEYYKALLALVHRAAFSNNRLINDLGIVNIIDEELMRINMAFITNNKTEEVNEG